MTRIYTKAGDSGESGLLSGERLPKDHDHFQVLGAIDELQALLGIVYDTTLSEAVKSTIRDIQPLLFDVSADLATTLNSTVENQVERISDKTLLQVEAVIDSLEGQLPKLTSFLVAGGNVSTSFLHLARAVCRRAERAIVTLGHETPINPPALALINRLSDLLFVLGRFNVLESKGTELQIGIRDKKVQEVALAPVEKPV